LGKLGQGILQGKKGREIWALAKKNVHLDKSWGLILRLFFDILGKILNGNITKNRRA